MNWTWLDQKGCSQEHLPTTYRDILWYTGRPTKYLDYPRFQTWKISPNLRLDMTSPPGPRTERSSSSTFPDAIDWNQWDLWAPPWTWSLSKTKMMRKWCIFCGNWSQKQCLIPAGLPSGWRQSSRLPARSHETFKARANHFPNPILWQICLEWVTLS